MASVFNSTVLQDLASGHLSGLSTAQVAGLIAAGMFIGELIQFSGLTVHLWDAL
jgi:hypothetical protein